MKKWNRRNFLKGGLLGGLVSGFTFSQKSEAATFEAYPERMGVLVDLSRCIGCRSCEAACNKEQGLPVPEKPFDDYSVFDELHHGQKRRPTEKAYTVVNRYDIEGIDHPLFRKIQCNHCNEPACLTSCFVNAYTKTPEGAVIYNPDVCVGCRTCMVACPFNIPAFRYHSALHPRIMKCIFCYDTRLKFGKAPACVEACPMQVMTFGKRDEVLRIAKKRIREKPGKYVDHVYGEKEAGGTSWLYISSVPFEKLGMDTTVPKEPILNYVKDFLSVVPMVLTIWPALFAGFHILATRKDAQKELENRIGEEE